MSFITPMFAAPMPDKPINIIPGEWVAEEKYDGHRLIVEVTHEPSPMVYAWSRNGISRVLPEHIIQEMRRLPRGTYDGELLVPGKRSYGVTDLANTADLAYTIFDIIVGHNWTYEGVSLGTRRQLLNEIFNDYCLKLHPLKSIKLANQWYIQNTDSLSTILNEVWARDGEGLILKNLNSVYVPGKRPKNTWIKMKQLQSAVLKVVGFIPSKGQINNRGAYATIVVKDKDDNYTTVKTRNDAECRRLEEVAPKGPLAWRKLILPDKKKLEYHVGALVEGDTFHLGEEPFVAHPDIGRELRIEFQERTSAEFIRRHPEYALSSYRHPRFDRWENE